MGLIDLHIHSNNSDGEYSTEYIIRMLKEKNISTFSITDHDNIDSCKEITIDEDNNMYYIKGVEISSILDDYNIHILGYDFNEQCNSIENVITEIVTARKARIIEMFEMLKNNYNIQFTNNEIINILNRKGTICIGDIIQLLYKYNYDELEVCKKSLKVYKSNIQYRISADKVLESINKDNGIPILAHPKEVENEYHIDIQSIMKDLIDRGLRGIEVFHSLHHLNDIKRYLEIAKRFNLLISAGSDYHGPIVKPNVELGNVSQEKINIKSLSLVDHLKNRH